MEFRNTHGLPSNASSRSSLCAWFPHWPVERLRHARPELERQPLILYRRGARKGNLVGACSADLARHGIVPDMSLAEARALAVGDSANSNHQPSLVIEEHDPLADRQALEQLAERCHRFSPSVSLSPTCADALWLDITGLASLYGGQIKLLDQFATFLQTERWTAHLALAETPAAAWALAQFHTAHPNSQRKRGPIDSEQQLDPPQEQPTTNQLATLPIDALRLSADVADSLTQLGLAEVGQLEQLSRAALVARFGPDLLAQLDRLWGRRADVLPNVREARTWEATFTFEAPVADYRVLLHVLGHLIAELAARLAAERLGATRVLADFDSTPAEGLRLELRLFRASANARRWLELATLELERSRLRAPVSTITVTAAATTTLEQRQRELFPHEERAAESQRLADALIERLTSRLGHQAVSRVSLAPELLPERSYRLTAAIAPRRATHKQTSKHAHERAPHGAPDAGSRPLELLPATRYPLSVRTAEDGTPTEFRSNNTWLRIVRTWGPERIESGWWRGRRARRDYYRVETDAGSQAWIYCRLEDERWFLHGWFI